MFRARSRPSLLVAGWLVIGVVVAAVENYFDTLDTAGQVLSALAAVLLWPLVLVGFDINITR